MCEKCKQAVDLLTERGYTDKQAMDILWAETAFPAGSGDFVLGQVKEFIKKQDAKKAKRINVTDKTVRRIDPEAVAKALGAVPADAPFPPHKRGRKKS